MATDRALLDLADRDHVAALRLYAWAPRCLSFGRHEPALRRYDRARLEALGLDTVRRPTGGRAVWHAAELTYSLAAPAALVGSLAETYDRIHRLFARALERLGVRAAMAPRPARAALPDAGACFAVPAGGELLVAGRKVLGSAQLRVGEAVLQHGSLLLAGDQRLVDLVRCDSPAPAGSAAAAAWDTGGALPLGRAVTFDEASAALAAAASDEWPVEAFGDIERFVADAGRRFAEFRDPAWTWRR
jgi:lipoate-protein ligase A